MPDRELVVSDTSPLLNLALIDRLDLLESQFLSITVPEQVWNELTEGEDGLDSLRNLRETELLSVVEVEQSDLFTEIEHELDALREAGFWISDDLYSRILAKVEK
jgi:predicted nucleic acid-binding protein